MTQVDLITGFLGAGKTTFLLKYCDWLKKQGVNYAIIENEFGAPGIDSAILKGSSDTHIAEISEGCICCTLKVSFHQLLSDLSEKYDRILVEPSGIFRMNDYFDIISGLVKEEKCFPGLCLTVVDPSSIIKLNENDKAILGDELYASSTVLWSKKDIFPNIDIYQCEQELLKIVSGLNFWPTPLHQLEADDFKQLALMKPVHRHHERSLQDHTGLYQSTRIILPNPVDLNLFKQCIDKICTKSGDYGEILRIKGHVLDQTLQRVSVNCTPSSSIYLNADSGSLVMNIIGTNLKRKAIKEELLCSVIEL